MFNNMCLLHKVVAVLHLANQSAANMMFLQNEITLTREIESYEQLITAKKL